MNVMFFTRNAGGSRVIRGCACGVLMSGSLLLAGGCGGRVQEPETAAKSASESRAVSRDARTDADSDADQVVKLAWLMCERLALMPDVARYKWNHRLPINDPQREAELLERLVEQAKSLEVPVEAARRFLQAQMDAAKIVQQAYFERWERENAPMFEDVPDLQTDLRPRIGRMTDALLHALAQETRNGEARDEAASASRRRRLREELLKRLPDDAPDEVFERLSEALP